MSALVLPASPGGGEDALVLGVFLQYGTTAGPTKKRRSDQKENGSTTDKSTRKNITRSRDHIEVGMISLFFVMVVFVRSGSNFPLWAPPLLGPPCGRSSRALRAGPRGGPACKPRVGLPRGLPVGPTGHSDFDHDRPPRPRVFRRIRI